MNKVKKFTVIASSKGSNIPLEITATSKNGTAYIAIKGGIYSWSSASSMDIETVIKGFKESGVTNAEIYIKSNGGDCFEANEILNIIEDNFSAKNVKVKVGAIAASAGTIFLTKYHSTAKPNSLFMIHKPMGNPSGNEDEIAAGLKLVKDMTKQYKAAYANKMSSTEAEIEELWAKGDHWMTAEEALESGLIDEIEKTEEAIDASTYAMLVASGAPNLPKPKENNNNNNQKQRMDLSVLAVQLGLPATATQAEVDAKIKAMKEAEINAQNLKNAADEKEKAEKSAKVKALLDKAEKEKKFAPKQRAHWKLMAESNYSSTEKALDAMVSIEAISTQLDPEGKQAAATKEQANWTYADYQEKDQKAFDKLPEAKQAELIEAHYED